MGEVNEKETEAREKKEREKDERKEEREKEEKISFWTTLPGILTAVALIITAIAGLTTALAGAGFFDKPPALVETPTVSPSATTPAVSPTAATPAVTTTATETASPFTVVAQPASARRGEEVALIFSRPAGISTVRLNGITLPIRAYPNYVVVTVPATATGGPFEIILMDGQTASAEFTVLPDTTVTTAKPRPPYVVVTPAMLITMTPGP